jgi:hypothetical protein
MKMNFILGTMQDTMGLVFVLRYQVELLQQ